MYQHKLKWLQLNHGIEAEYFMPAFTKFKSRWSVESEITTRKSWTSLHIRPFTKFKLYYYKGGAYLSYYDEDGDLLQKSADDIHRWLVWRHQNAHPAFSKCQNLLFLE